MRIRCDYELRSKARYYVEKKHGKELRPVRYTLLRSDQVCRTKPVGSLLPSFLCEGEGERERDRWLQGPAIFDSTDLERAQESVNARRELGKSWGSDFSGPNPAAVRSTARWRATRNERPRDGRRFARICAKHGMSFLAIASGHG